MNIVIEGVLELQVFDNGKLIDTIKEKNLIVNSGRTLMLERFVTDIVGADNFEMSNIIFGTGQAPVAQSNDISTFVDYFMVPITSKSLNVLGTSAVAQFNFTVSTSVGNGKNIYEFGLLAGDPEVLAMLFSRRVRTAPITKTNTMSFTGTWSIIATFS